MAGSWAHMTTKSGKLRNNENFCEMIENLGDAYEAAEECFGMIWWLAAALADTEADDKGYLRELIQQAQENYKDGLELGGVQRSK